jgi:hypothetical protein
MQVSCRLDFSVTPFALGKDLPVPVDRRLGDPSKIGLDVIAIMPFPESKPGLSSQYKKKTNFVVYFTTLSVASLHDVEW